MKYKRTLITGGKGLVGSALQSDFKPAIQDVDLLNFDSIVNYITENQIDSIIHCAAKVGGIKANTEHLADFYTENITMNSNLLQAAHQCGVKKVVSFMSTCVFPDDAVYPLTPDQIHKGEPHPSNFAYAYAKRMLEVQSRAYREQYDCNFVTVIPCNIYGPNDNYDLESGHVIPSLIHKCYMSKQCNTYMEVWGTGKPYREFIYSKDVAYIAQWVLENYDDPEPLIISPDEEISIATIAQEIAWRMEFDGKIIFNNKRDGQFRKPSDNSKLKSLLPDYKFVPIEIGLKKSIDWFIKNYEECRK
jgi:GDP-L-fucose synthase